MCVWGSSNECGVLPRHDKHFHIDTGKTERAHVLGLSRSGTRKSGKNLLFHNTFKQFLAQVVFFFLKSYFNT